MQHYGFRKQKIVPTTTKVVWTHFSEPTKEEYEKLATDFNLSEEFLEGLNDEHEIPQLEVGKKYTKILLQIPTKINNTYRTFPFALIYGKQKLTTICERKNEYLDEIFTFKFERSTIQEFIIELLFIIESEYEKNIKTLIKRTKQKKLNLSTLNNNDIVELVELEDALNNILTSSVPNSTIYAKIMQKRLLDFTIEDQDEFVDILNSAKQTTEQTKLTIKTVQNIRNAYSTIMTNNLNSIMKVLTAATILLALPTLISSIYGMNVTLPFQNDPRSFLVVIASSIIISTTLFIFLRWKKWI